MVQLPLRGFSLYIYMHTHIYKINHFFLIEEFGYGSQQYVFLFVVKILPFQIQIKSNC